MSENDVEIRFGGQLSGLDSAVSQATSVVGAGVAKMKADLAQLPAHIQSALRNTVAAQTSAQSALAATLQRSQMAVGITPQAEAQTASILSSLKAKFASLGTSARSSLSSIPAAMQPLRGEFSGLTALAGKFNGALIAIGAVVAGGAMFKSAVSATVNWNIEIRKLIGTLDLTPQKAMTLKVALDNVGSSTEQYLAVVRRLTPAIAQHANKIENLGVKTRDTTTGALRPTSDVLQDLIEHWSSMDGTMAKAEMSTVLGGRAWMQMLPLLRMNKEATAEAAEEVKKLGLSYNPEQLKAYQKASAEVHMVLERVKMIVGEALIPVLINLASVLKDSGPPAAQAFGNALKGIAIACVELSGGLLVVGAGIVALNNALYRLEHLDLSGAKQEFTTFGAYATKVAKDTSDKISHILNPPAMSGGKTGGKGAAGAEGAGGDGTGGGGGGKKGGGAPAKAADTWFSDQRKALDLKEDEAGVPGLTPDQVVAYWKTLLDAQKKGSERYQQAYHEYIVALRAAGKEHEANLKEQQRAEEQAERDHNAAVKTLLDERLRQQREHQDALIALKLEDINYQEESGQLSTGDALQAKLGVENEKYGQDRAATAQPLEMGPLPEQEQAEVYGKLDKLADDHAFKVKKLNHAIALDAQRSWAGVFAPVGQAISTSVQGIVMGTTTAKKALQNLWVSVLAMSVNGLTQLALKEAAHWAWGIAGTKVTEAAKTIAVKLGVMSRTTAEGAGAAAKDGLGAADVATTGAVEAAKTVATVAGVTARTTAEVTGATIGATTSISFGLTDILVSAYRAAAGAYAAIAAIPYVGPFLAPVMAAAALAAVIGMGMHIASAAGGMDVDRDRLAMIHKEEMVLPANLASGVRQMVAQGGPGGGAPGGRGGDVHLHVHAQDARDVKRFFSKHRNDIAKILIGAKRDFAVVPG